MKRFVLFALLAVTATNGVAADDPATVATTALRKLVPNAKVDSVVPATLPGFYAIVVDGHPMYLSTDGKYLIEGHIYDVDTRRDVIDDALSGLRKKELAGIPASKRITFAPAQPKYHVTVFTDVDCPYCREFHKQIAEYNNLGIAVDYVLFPLSIHPGADKKAQTVWCSKDRNAAYTQAMDGKALSPLTCSNPIAEITNIAGAMGVNGTPGIFADDGSQLGGYVPPQQLAQRLQQMAQPKPAP